MKRRRKDEHENEDDNEHIGGREDVIPPLPFFNRTRYRARARPRSLKVAGEKAMERRARERGR